MEILLTYLYEAAGQSNDILSEDEYHENDKHPKTFHLCLLPPCQFTLYLDDLFDLDLPISINDAVPVFYRPLRRYFLIVCLVFKRVR